MNADPRPAPDEIVPLRLRVPPAALERLRLRLGRAEELGEAWNASFAYGAPVDDVIALARYWRDHFPLEEQALFNLACFETEVADTSLCFVHQRSSDASAVPLLLLHGYSGSIAEFQSLVEPLSNRSVHVVCPALPGFLDAPTSPISARRAAWLCAELMRRLGYTRYAVHGSDLGGNVALELAAIAEERVAAVHLTAVAAYPSELTELTCAEKSRLARLQELHHELSFLLPESPLEELAFSLSRCDRALAPRDKDTLLTSLTLSWALGSASSRAQLYRASLLAEAPDSGVPLAVHAFPLAAPSLRRFAERRYRIAAWQEHDSGGPMPAVEQPTLLLESLRGFCERLR